MGFVKIRFYKWLLILGIIAFSVWLFFMDDAAQPGELSSAHLPVSTCDNCHIPWQGVSNDRCLSCHEFSDVTALPPRIRFHEAEKFCRKCHTEHQGVNADISQVNHTLFNGKLQCTQCHLARHHGLFGQNCRECHGITTWKVQGFRHPPAETKECNRCHRAPASHYAEQFWSRIESTHSPKGEPSQPVPRKECWRCHTVHRWSHLMMEHTLR